MDRTNGIGGTDIAPQFCHCGCGKTTSFYTKTCNQKGYKKGETTKYINGHWKAKGRIITNHPFVLIPGNGHGRAHKSGYVLEHIVIAEKAFGESLPPGAVVHHVNGDSTDNRHGNLVVCQDRSYHWLLHRRQNAINSCGHAHWLKCSICKQWDKPENIKRGRHRKCHAEYNKKSYHRAKATNRG